MPARCRSISSVASAIGSLFVLQETPPGARLSGTARPSEQQRRREASSTRRDSSARRLGERLTLGLRLRDERAERAAEVGVGRGDALCEGRRQLVLLPLEGGLRLSLAGLEPLLADLARLREPLGKDGVRLADERLDRTVELA